MFWINLRFLVPRAGNAFLPVIVSIMASMPMTATAQSPYSSGADVRLAPFDASALDSFVNARGGGDVGSESPDLTADGTSEFPAESHYYLF